jgi:pyruvate dehydrogenase phosphatase
LTARPEVIHKNIANEFKFLILASDGLFDVFSNNDMVKQVGYFLSNQTSDQNAATHLIRAALEESKGIKHLSRMISLPSSISRRYRDDMTCQVVFFNTLEQDLKSANTIELKRDI